MSISMCAGLLWSFGLVPLAYTGLLVREVLFTGSRHAIGVGILFRVLYNPWFWILAVTGSVFMALWKLR